VSRLQHLLKELILKRKNKYKLYQLIIINYYHLNILINLNRFKHLKKVKKSKRKDIIINFSIFKIFNKYKNLFIKNRKIILTILKNKILINLINCVHKTPNQ
jgi:hypothetical protein